MQERRNSIANALELRLSCTNPLICPIKHANGFIVLCIALAISSAISGLLWFIYLCSSGLLHWHSGTRMISPLPQGCEVTLINMEKITNISKNTQQNTTKYVYNSWSVFYVHLLAVCWDVIANISKHWPVMFNITLVVWVHYDVQYNVLFDCSKLAPQCPIRYKLIWFVSGNQCAGCSVLYRQFLHHGLTGSTILPHRCPVYL